MRLQTGEQIVHCEECSILYRGLKERAEPTPWPSHSSEIAWIQRSGALILTNKRLLFFAKPTGLLASGPPTLAFATSRHGLTASITNPGPDSTLLGILIGTSPIRFATLEVLIGTNPVCFAVKEPAFWYDLLYQSEY